MTVDDGGEGGLPRKKHTPSGTGIRPGRPPASAAPARPRNDPGQYDDLAEHWWDDRGPFALLHSIAAARAWLIPPAARSGALLVDLACGGGLLAPHIAGLGYRHVGLDLTASALQQAHGRQVRVARADVLALPLPDAVADVVVAGEILEHVTDLDTAVAEACRILRPGGRLIVDTLADTFLARLVAVRIAEHVPGGAPPGIHDPALFVDRERLQRLADDHGVPLVLRGLRPSVRGLVTLSTRRGAPDLVPTRSTAILFQAWGNKAPIVG